MKRTDSIGLYVLLIVLLGCGRKDPLPLEDFYSFADISRINLRADRTDYYLGSDSLLIPVVAAYDSINRSKALPDSAFTYFFNGQRVASNQFVFTYNQRQRIRNVIENGRWLPTPGNRGKGGRVGASESSRPTDRLVVPTIWLCPVQH